MSWPDFGDGCVSVRAVANAKALVRMIGRTSGSVNDAQGTCAHRPRARGALALNDESV